MVNPKKDMQLKRVWLTNDEIDTLKQITRHDEIPDTYYQTIGDIFLSAIKRGDLKL